MKVVLIENLRLHSNEQIELAQIAKNIGFEVRYFETLKSSLKILNPLNFLNLNEEYIVFCSIYTLKALLNINNDLIEKYSQEELLLLNHFKKFIHYNVERFNNISHNHMFNKFEKVSISLFQKSKETYFIKSLTGLKEFNSGILYKEHTFKEYLNLSKTGKYILKQYYKSKIKNYEILRAIPKDIFNANEYRFFIANDMIVGSSQYMTNGEFECNKTFKEEVLVFAKNMIKIYQPMSYFVMDIIEIDGNLSVLEYNCFNSSGMYDIDKENLLEYFKV